MQSRDMPIHVDTLAMTSSIPLTPMQSLDSVVLDLESADLALQSDTPLRSRDTLSVDVQSLGVEISPSPSLQSRTDISVELQSLRLDMSPSVPMDSRDLLSVDHQSPDSDMSPSIPMESRDTVSIDLESIDLDMLPSSPIQARDAISIDLHSADSNMDSSIQVESRDTISVNLHSADLDMSSSSIQMESRDSISLDVEDLDTADVEVDTPDMYVKKLGPRTIGVGGKFFIPAEDLPPTLYDRSFNNPFSPYTMDEPSDVEGYDTIESDDVTTTEDDRGRDDIAYDSYEDDGWYDETPPEPTMTVPWLMPRRTDGSFSTRTLSRRGFLGDHAVGVDAGINGHAGDIGLPSVRPSPKPMSEDIRPGLGASIALSVIVGLVILVLTVYTGLKYRRKKRDLKSSEREKDSGREDEGEDEDTFTGLGRGGNDTEIDEEKGLKSPSPSAIGDTPGTKKGFRLWSPLPLFSPSRSQSRSRELDTPPPTRRAVLCSPSPVFTSLRTSSPGPSSSPAPSPAPSPLSRSSMPRGDTMQSLMDALDSPLPLPLETIDEAGEELSLRSRASLKDLHHRLSTASTSDSIRRLSATSTYSTCSERSSIYDDVQSNENHSYERSNSVSSESSDSSSAYLETPVRIQTPVLADESAGVNRFEQAGGLLLPTMPSAASIHEALDDMIGLFSPPPVAAQKRADITVRSGLREDDEELDALAKAAEAIGKVAFAQLQKNAQTQSSPSLAAFESPARPTRPHNPLIKNPLFSLGEDEDSEPSWTPVAEKQIDSPRPPPPTRRHTLPIALLSRRSSIPPSPKPESRYSELYSKDHLQRALSAIRSRQNSLPTVSESDSSGPSSFVQAAYKFTASMGAEKIQLQQRRMTLTTKYENAMARPATPEQQEPTPERLALAKFLASVADTEDDDDEDDFTPYWGSEDEADARWLVYEENFPLPESGLPQIMVTCH
jgi:hypothetical protein